LPSSRSLAADLRVARNVNVAAYEELHAEGYLDGRHGSGAFICRDLLVPVPSATAASPARPSVAATLRSEGRLIEFRSGRPSVGPLPAPVWRRIWREVGD
jgi:GntR family transcriptional regulator/MocR family aminotransferase